MQLSRLCQHNCILSCILCLQVASADGQHAAPELERTHSTYAANHTATGGVVRTLARFAPIATSWWLNLCPGLHYEGGKKVPHGPNCYWQACPGIGKENKCSKKECPFYALSDVVRQDREKKAKAAEQQSCSANKQQHRRLAAVAVCKFGPKRGVFHRSDSPCARARV